MHILRMIFFFILLLRSKEQKCSIVHAILHELTYICTSKILWIAQLNKHHQLQVFGTLHLRSMPELKWAISGKYCEIFNCFSRDYNPQNIPLLSCENNVKISTTTTTTQAKFLKCRLWKYQLSKKKILETYLSFYYLALASQTTFNNGRQHEAYLSHLTNENFKFSNRAKESFLRNGM